MKTPQKLKSIFSAIHPRNFGRLLHAVFGTLSWTAPTWLSKVGRKLNLRRVRRDKPGVFWGTIAGVVLVLAGAYGWHYWQTHRPQPNYVAVAVVAPTVTPNKEELKPEPLFISFYASVAKLEHVGKKVDNGITITPALAGEWTWRDDKQLAFVPSTDWLPGRTYEVKFDEAFFPDHVLLEKHEYEFTTPAFAAEIPTFEFYQDPTDAKVKKTVATVRFTHPVNAADFESKIKLETTADDVAGLGAVPRAFTVKYDKHRREAYVHSENLTPEAKSSFMALTIPAGLEPEVGDAETDAEVTKQVSVPGIADFFRVEEVWTDIVRDDQGEPKQVLVIRTRDGVKPDDLKSALSVLVLPKDKPAEDGVDEIKDHVWKSPAEVTPKILALATPVELKAVPGVKEYETLHSFTYKQPGGVALYVRVSKGIKSFGGYALQEDHDDLEEAPYFPRELKIMHEGSLLSLTGERKLSLLTRDIGEIRTEFYRVLPQAINDFVTQNDGDFHDPDFYGYSYNEENFTEIFSENKPLDNSDPATARYTAIDFAKHLEGQKGLFVLKVRQWNPDTEDDDGYESDRRVVLVTDMGLLIKWHSDGKRDVFVHSLAAGGPVANAEVSVLAKNGLAVATAVTDDAGRVTFDNLDGLERDKEPVAFIAKKGDDLSFIPFNDRGRELDFSDYDVGGLSLYGKNKLKAYVFSDRGIYRPGETLKAGIIIKSTDWQQKPAAVPLEVVVKDARGLVVQKEKIMLPASGYFDVAYQTDETAQTGTYNVNVYLIQDEETEGGEYDEGEDTYTTYLGGAAMKVEEFLPDQMKITTRFSTNTSAGWINPKDVQGLVSLNNLYGTPASKRTVAAKISLSPAFPSFTNHKDYQFYNPLKLETAVNEELPTAVTDADGNAKFDLDLTRYSGATYRLNFLAQGFAAAGGRSVDSESSVLVSPLDALIGYKPDADLSFLKRGSLHKIHLIAVDPKLERVPVQNLKAELVEKRYVSTLLEQADSTLRYQSVLTEIPTSETTLSWTTEGLDYDIPTAKAGDFELRLFGTDGVKVSQIAFSIAGEANLTRALDRTAELKMTLSKTEYAPGEEIEINVKAPYAGSGLITIERDKVFASAWFKADTTATIQKIRIPEDFEGGGYVNIAFVRARDSREIFMSPLSYGVAPFSVNLAKRTEPVEITVPELVKPGETLAIKYRTDKPSKIVVWAVDEGILQFAGYPTPDPLTTFFEKRALEVRTMQTLDLILPEYSVYKNTAAAGGDQGYKFIGNNLNPFRRKSDPPVVFWSGVIDSGPEVQTKEFTVPDYFNGSLRVMALAVNDERVGIAEKTTQVRGPFIITPSLPLFVAPGDAFDVNLIVANNVKGSGSDPEIRVTLESSAGLEVAGEKTKNVKIGELTESSVAFSIKAGASPGEASLSFTAGLGGETARASTSLSIRPPTPFMTTFTTGRFDSGAATAPVDRDIHAAFRKLEAGVSVVPLSLSRGLASFLSDYPYDCTEQLVSKALPAVVLKDHGDFAADMNKSRDAFVKTLALLRTRQNADGSFRYWPEKRFDATENSADENADGEEREPELSASDRFATVYALHFLTEAKDRGEIVPADMLVRGKAYLKKFLTKPIKDNDGARLYAYATYLLTLGGEVTSNSLSNLIQYLDKDVDNWQSTLTGAYVASVYKLLKHDEEADRLIGSYEWSASAATDHFFNDGSASDALYLYLVAKHFPEKLKTTGAAGLDKIVDPLLKDRYHTLFSAYAILALDAYAREMGKNPQAETSAEELGKDGKKTKLALSKGLFATANFSEDARQIAFTAPGGQTAYYQILQSGFDKALPTQEIKQGLEITRELVSENGEALNSVPVGETVTVRLSLRSVTGSGLPNLVIVDLLPGGFEVGDDPALRDAVSATVTHNTWQPDYGDIREDRVILYGSASADVQQFTYRIKAVSPGEYQVPPAYGESMYRRDVKARGVGGKITITPN